MDWKQFFASVIGSLAWPAAFVAFCLIFRPQILRILGQVKKFRAAGFDFELEEQLKAAKDVSNAVQREDAVSAPDVQGLDQYLLALAKASPEDAVLQVFDELTRTIGEIKARLPDDKPYRNSYEVLKKLSSEKRISESAVALFVHLRQARNAAALAEGQGMTEQTALGLIQKIKQLQSLLSGILDKTPPRNNRV